MSVSLTNLFFVALIAFGAPLVAAAVPRSVIPAVVLEIVAGIVFGPNGLDLIAVDDPIRVMALLGLAFLLFLAGLEVDVSRLRGPILRAVSVAFVVSFTLAIGVGAGLLAAGRVDNVLFTAIVLCATSLGVIVPIIKDAGAVDSDFGQLVIAAASIADFAAVILLTAFFSQQSGGVASRLVLLAAFGVAATLVAAGLIGLRHFGAVSRVLVRLQDTTAQIRVRGAFVLLTGLVAFATSFGLESILGAFAAGLILSFADRDPDGTHPRFRPKLEGAGYGFFIPAFFVTVGLRFDLDAVTSDASAVASIPLFLLALLVIRGLPALLYRELDGGMAVAAGVLQATSLPFIVAATMIGTELGVVSSGTAASMVGAGVLSVVLFPPLGAALIGGETARADPSPWESSVADIELRRS